MGTYRNKNQQENNTKEDVDIYDVVATALHFGISYKDLGHMNFIELANLLDAFAPKKHKPTQAEIDLIT